MENELDIKQVPEETYCTGGLFYLKILIICFVLVFSAFISLVGISNSFFPTIYSREWSDLCFSYGGILDEYLNEHNGSYPPIESWCDEIAAAKEEYSFSYDADAAVKECGYAINPEAFALGRSAPKDMVLMFPSVKGWNLSGGPELLRVPSNKRVAILFSENEHSKALFVRSWEVPYLKWSVSDTGIIPRDSFRTARNYGLAALFVWLSWIFFRYSKSMNMAFLIAVLPAILGGIFGAMSQFSLYEFGMYNMYESGDIGLIVGGLAGLLAGVHYCGFMSRHIQKKGAKKVHYVTEYVFYGIFTGLLTSVLTHLYMMIAYREETYWPLVAGLGFGGWAGAIVGLATYFAFGGSKRRLPNVEVAQESVDVLPPVS